MSTLLVSNDLDIMMLEFAVQKLFLPKTSVFDDVIMKKTTVMFRMLDPEWTAVNPQRTDYAPYYGSNLEELNFNGGKSVVFAIPTDNLKTMIKGVDIQIHVIKEVSKYFESNPNLERQNVGVAFANVDHLFNGIIKDLREREELKQHLNGFHKREPISRSLKEKYEIIDENQQQTGATIEIYVRLNYFGKSVITEIEKERGLRPMFYAQEETNEKSPYQCRELERSELESGCWGKNNTFSSPVRSDQLVCHCDKWGITDHNPDKSRDKKLDGDSLTDKSKGGLNSKNGENIGKGFNDDNQLKNRGKKMGKNNRLSKSADELGRNFGTRDSKEESSGQKHVTSLKDKRAKGDSEDRKTIRKLDKTGAKSSIDSQDQTEDSLAAKAYAKSLLMAQLRRRCRGNVTVGIDSKKKNICEVSIVSPQGPSPTCPSALMSPKLCNGSSCNSGSYYPSSYACNSPSVPVTHGCFIHG